MSILTCPVCRGTMREVEHRGVHIDTCTQCRGVWLDRGELEKIASTMGDGYGSRNRGRGDDDDDDDDDYKRDRSRNVSYRDDDNGRPPRRRSSFLDFFD